MKRTVASDRSAQQIVNTLQHAFILLPKLNAAVHIGQPHSTVHTSTSTINSGT